MKKRIGSTMRTTNNTNGAAAATSPANMGKALVLLATGCAALSGNPMTAPAAGPRRAAPSQQRSPSALRHHPRRHSRQGRVHRPNSDGAFNSIVALNYRDGDEDQPPEARAANAEAVASASSGNAKVATPTRGRVSTHFLFTPISKIMMPTKIPHPQSTSVTTSSRSREEDEQQLVMDEYLEFVERRYSRMHPRHKHHRHRGHSKNHGVRPRVVFDLHLPRKIFLSTLSFHRSTAIEPSPPRQQQPVVTRTARPSQAEDEDEEEPLDVLGLTNLASERLRQRLHVPRDLRDEAALLTSGAHFIQHVVHLNDPYRNAAAASRATNAARAAISNAVVPVKASASKALEEAGGRTSSYIALSFPAQVKLLLATMYRVTAAFVNTLKILTAFSSRMFSEILDRGGFRHSLRMMSVASVAVLLMFKPLFRGALKGLGEGA